MTLPEQQQRLEQAIAYVWMYELGALARLPRRARDREALRRARLVAQSRKRLGSRRLKL
jgi:hypothetical protein